MKEQRSELRVALEHARMMVDLIHIALEQLPDPKEKDCSAMGRCSDCDPTCAGIHSLKAAAHWATDVALKLEKLERAERAVRAANKLATLGVGLGCGDCSGSRSEWPDERLNAEIREPREKGE